MKRFSFLLFFALIVISLQGFSPPDIKASQSEIVFNVDNVYPQAQIVDNVFVFDNVDIELTPSQYAGAPNALQIYFYKSNTQETSLEVLKCPVIQNRYFTQSFAHSKSDLISNVKKSVNARITIPPDRLIKRVSVFKTQNNNYFLCR